MNVYPILEVASTHGGSMEYIDQLLQEFDEFRGMGMKFQPFKFDLLADETYKGYSTYKKLYFDSAQWALIITKVSVTKEVWLDLFDEFSVSILLENIDKIKGFKLQSSVLGNYPLRSALSGLPLKNKICILNISGYEKGDIDQEISELKQTLGCEIVLQAGFQSHPTEFGDSGLGKLSWLKEQFPDNRLSFTDHVEDSSEDVLILPLVASFCGAQFIEKHIKCEMLPTEYDYYSSINHRQFSELAGMFRKYLELYRAEFINDRERKYLSSSRLVPMVKNGLAAGQLISLLELDYKRTSKNGLSSVEIRRLIQSRFLVSSDLVAGATIGPQDMRTARIGAIVACRMKSSRLARKALRKIGELTSIELCIKNTLQFSNVDEVVLATSTHEDDAILKNYTYSDQVKFFQGSENDVIDRFLNVAKLYQLDIVIRVTGDSPYRSDDVLQLLLKKHFDQGADYTAAGNAAIGTNIEVINVTALNRAYELFGGTPYSEYMSYYFKNNPTLFKLNIVQLPEEFVNGFRLTLDYEEDLRMFVEIEKNFNHSGQKFDALSLYEFLRNNPDIAQINSNCEIAYKDDSDLLKQLREKTTYKNV